MPIRDIPTPKPTARTIAYRRRGRQAVDARYHALSYQGSVADDDVGEGLGHDQR